jgi:sodium-dependent phosphate cotransporter
MGDHATRLPLEQPDRRSTYGRALLLAALLYVFLVGVNGLGAGLRLLGGGLLDDIFRATANPFLGLVIGVLGTSLVQSSSVTTSVIVAMVAAPENALPLTNAVPMIMGANIGTTVTNTMVSLAHMRDRDEFRRAFAVATCHDWFNFLTVVLLLPLELALGFLQHSAEWLAALATGWGGVSYHSPIEGAIRAGIGPIKRALAALTPLAQIQAVLLIAASAAMIYVALIFIVKTMRSLVKRQVESAISRALDSNPMISMAVGMVVTIMVQSSSITTSLLVPLGGAGVITLAQAFPTTIGANAGTTVTALIAAASVSGPHAAAGVTIALVHFLFNVAGTVLIYPLKPIRNIPLSLARRLADVAARSRWAAVAYVGFFFYLLPAILAWLSR